MVKFDNLDRIIKLINEYCIKLKDLLGLLQLQKKRKVIFLLFAIFIFLGVYTLVLYYFKYEELFDSLSIIAIGLFLSFIILGLFMYAFFRQTRNSRDIIDDIRLVSRQLAQLVRMLSQTREHMIDKNDFLIQLEIDLKMTEAEDLLDRTDRFLD